MTVDTQFEGCHAFMIGVLSLKICKFVHCNFASAMVLKKARQEVQYMCETENL